MSQRVTILGNKIACVHDTRTCGRIPIHIGSLPASHAHMHVEDVVSSFRSLNFDVEFYQTTNDIYWHALVGLHPYIFRLDIGRRPASCSTDALMSYRNLLKTWYDWCNTNCQSEFSITHNGFDFENIEDYLLFRIAFGDPLMMSSDHA